MQVKIVKPKQKALITEPFNSEGIEILSQIANCDIELEITPEELLKIAHEYEILIVRSQVPVSRNLIEAAKRLKIVGVACVGYEKVDIQAATENSIIVVNSPNLNTDATAEFTFGSIMALTLQLFEAHTMIMDGLWERNRIMKKRRQLSELVIGVVGCGAVGIKVCELALKNGVKKVLAHSKSLSIERAKQIGINLVSLEELMAKSDIVTLHPRLSSSNVGMINAKMLSLMQPHAYLVNTARSSLINVADLVNVLRSRKIAGAALDVFDQEPLTDSPLRALNNVILTCHLAGCSETASKDISIELANNIVSFLNGMPARNVVN